VGAKKGFIEEDSVPVGTSLTKGLYSVGNTILHRKAYCKNGKCRYHFWIRDEFTDPLDLGLDFGFPYNIQYDFWR